MNLCFRLWIKLTVWMLEHDKFSYSHLSDRELLGRFRSYKQGWPWVDANLEYALKRLKRL